MTVDITDAVRICENVIKKKGIAHQVHKCIEEMGELASALMQFDDGRKTMAGVREETAKMIEDDSINAIDNLMPACRACNFYKGINNIDGLRRRIREELEHTCRSTFQTRLAMQYGMIEYRPWDGKFYFEKMEEN